MQDLSENEFISEMENNIKYFSRDYSQEAAPNIAN